MERDGCLEKIDNLKFLLNFANNKLKLSEISFIIKSDSDEKGQVTNYFYNIEGEYQFTFEFVYNVKNNSKELLEIDGIIYEQIVLLDSPMYKDADKLSTYAFYRKFKPQYDCCTIKKLKGK